MYIWGLRRVRSQTPAQVISPVLRSEAGDDDEVPLGDGDSEPGGAVVIDSEVKVGETMRE